MKIAWVVVCIFLKSILCGGGKLLSFPKGLPLEFRYNSLYAEARWQQLDYGVVKRNMIESLFCVSTPNHRLTSEFSRQAQKIGKIFQNKPLSRSQKVMQGTEALKKDVQAQDTRKHEQGKVAHEHAQDKKEKQHPKHQTQKSVDEYVKEWRIPTIIMTVGLAIMFVCVFVLLVKY